MCECDGVGWGSKSACVSSCGLLIGLIDHVVEKCQWTLTLPPVNVSLGIAPRARWSRLSSIFHDAALLPPSRHTARPEIMMMCGAAVGHNATPLGLP